MPRQAVVYTVVVATAADTDEERQAVVEAIADWNATHSAATGAVLLPVPREVPSASQTSDRDGLRDADILIGAFWTRLGTATEEIDELRRAGKRVLLYFSDAPVIPSRANREQYGQLEDYRLRCERERVAEGYASVDELRVKLPRHLATVVGELHVASPEPAAPPRVETAPARAAAPVRAEASPPAPSGPAVRTGVSRVAPVRKLSEQRRLVSAPRPEPVRPAPIAREAADQTLERGSAAVIKEGGWWGARIGDDFYAWEGPLADLPEHEPVEMSRELDPRLRTALNDAGVLPDWETKTDLLTWRDEQRVFITDRRTYKRAIVSGKDVLVVRPVR